MSVHDPFAALQLHEHDVAVHDALTTEAAQYIQYAIVEQMAELEEAGPGGQVAFMRGMRMGLRLAFLLAGGDVDGSEEQWRQVVEATRG